MCIGNNFALIEGTLILATVCQRYRVLPVLGPDVSHRRAGDLPAQRWITGAGCRRETHTDFKDRRQLTI